MEGEGSTFSYVAVFSGYCDSFALRKYELLLNFSSTVDSLNVSYMDSLYVSLIDSLHLSLVFLGD